MVDYIFDFFDQTVLEQPHAHTMGTQGGHFRPQAFRTVVADHRNFFSIFESKADEAQCYIFDIFKVTAPGDGTPDTKLFLPHGHLAFTVFLGLLVKQLGYCQIFRNFHIITTLVLVLISVKSCPSRNKFWTLNSFQFGNEIFFDEQDPTRVFVEAYIGIRPKRKPAENAAHRKKGHFWMETNYLRVAYRSSSPRYALITSG